jgi:RND family efflux transporter MFP subunit
MFPLKKSAALAAGLAAALAVAGLNARQDAVAQPPRAAEPETLVVDEATVDWIEKSNVAALREGVIQEMELRIGMPVVKGGRIGSLHSELATLAVKKAQVAVDRQAPRLKSAAQKELAVSKVAINKRLNTKMKGAVSLEEMMQAEAELKVAEALTIEAAEQLKNDEVELELAKQTLDEHTITAPFDGVVIERMKHPGEKVGQNEAVVQLGNLDKLRAFAYVPLEYAFRVKESQVVDLQLKLEGVRNVPVEIERKRFRGKITFVDPQVQAVGETGVRIYVEFDNRGHELKPGLKGTLAIYLGTETNGAAPSQAIPPTARAGGVGVGR